MAKLISVGFFYPLGKNLKEYMTQHKENIDPIPEEFSSYEEVADFWDSHNTIDYPDDFEDVEVHAKFIHRHFEVEVDEGVDN